MAYIKRVLAVLLSAVALTAVTLVAAPTQTEAVANSPSCRSNLGDGGLEVGFRHLPEDISRVHIRRDGKWLRAIQAPFEPDDGGTIRGFTLDHVFPDQGRFGYQLRYRVAGEVVELDCGVAQTIQDFIGDCTVTRADGIATVRINFPSEGINRYHIRSVAGSWQKSFDTRIDGDLVFVDDTPEDQYLVRFRAGQITDRFDNIFENVCSEA